MSEKPPPDFAMLRAVEILAKMHERVRNARSYTTFPGPPTAALKGSGIASIGMPMRMLPGSSRKPPKSRASRAGACGPRGTYNSAATSTPFL
jgi:hypothetical protein